MLTFSSDLKNHGGRKHIKTHISELKSVGQIGVSDDIFENLTRNRLLSFSLFYCNYKILFAASRTLMTKVLSVGDVRPADSCAHLIL